MGTLSSPSLQSLITEVRIQLNQPDPTNSFWGEPELSGYLNDAVRRYFVEYSQANEGAFTTTSTLNIVSSAESIALPSDFFELKNLWKKITNGYMILRYHNDVDESFSTQGGSSSESYSPVYTFRGNNLVLHPTPNFSETAGLLLEYIQFPSTMVWGGETLTSHISPIFKELIVMYAVYRAKLREAMVNGGSMHTIPLSLVGDLETKFRSAIVKRSKNPTYVQPFSPESE